MNTDLRDCVQCGDEFERVIGTSRIKCFKCSPARISAVPGKPRDISPRQTAVTDTAPPAPPVPRPPGRIEKNVARELEQLGVLDSVEGALCEAFARDLDNPELPAAGRASMSKQLSAMLEVLRSSIPPAPDELDEFAEAAKRRAEELG